MIGDVYFYSDIYCLDEEPDGLLRQGYLCPAEECVLHMFL
jgi:hypothetical protein